MSNTFYANLIKCLLKIIFDRAFATTGALESQYSIKYGKKLNLSEQQLVSCDKRNKGCDGIKFMNSIFF